MEAHLRTRNAFLPQCIGRKGKPMFLEALELPVGPCYEPIKLKLLEARIATKCTPEDLPEGTLARDTSLKAFQLDERAERRMPPNLAV